MNRPRARRFLVGAVTVTALILLAVQFVPVKRQNPPVTTDLVAPAEVKAVLRRACYDCHSHETRWPWYSRMAPVSWWVAAHVEKGRADLNFSQWPVFDLESRALFLRDIEKQIEDGTMPLKSYVLGHPEARLTAGENELILAWVRAGY